MFYPKSPLFEEAQEGNPAGGGDSSLGADHADDGNQHQDGPPASPALTFDALKDLLKLEREAQTREFTKQINGLDAKFKKQFEQQKPKEPKPEIMTAEQMLADYKRESEERIAAIERERDEEKLKSQQKEMDAEIKSALSPFPWSTDAKGNAEGPDVAFSFYRMQTQRDDDGKLMIGGMPLAAYIKEDAARRFKGMHSARPIGGSGNASNRGAAPPTIMNDTLIAKARSGEALTPDERAAVRAELLASNLIPKK